jgi:hypothetical protein
MNTGIYTPINYTGTDSIFLKEAAKVIYAHKEDFDEWIKGGQKLQAVKFLKDCTKGGLKESKDAFDLYCAGKLRPDIREDRKKKLEQLARKPLVDQLIVKLKNIDDDTLHSLLMKLSIDELLSIDEFFPESE